MTTTFLPETHAAVAARAFAFWLEEGQPHGRNEIHWQRAFAEVTAANTNDANATDVSPIDGAKPRSKIDQVKATTPRKRKAS